MRRLDPLSGKHHADAAAWRGDWHARIDERVRAIGHHSFQEFFDSHSGLSYVELAQMVGPTGDVAPVQMERLHAEVAGGNDASRRGAILDSLTRFLRGALKKGWGSGRYWQSSVTGALASWVVTWGGTEDLRQVTVSLFAKRPPTGWIPEPKNDPLLTQVFEQALCDDQE